MFPFLCGWKLRQIGVTNLINYKWLHFFCLASIQGIPIQRVSEVWSVLWVSVRVLWQLKGKWQWIFSLEVLANYHVDAKFSERASGMGNENIWTHGDVPKIKKVNIQQAPYNRDSKDLTAKGVLKERAICKVPKSMP